MDPRTAYDVALTLIALRAGYGPEVREIIARCVMDAERWAWVEHQAHMQVRGLPPAILTRREGNA